MVTWPKPGYRIFVPSHKCPMLKCQHIQSGALGLDMLICVGKRREKDRESLRDRDRNSESDRQTGGGGGEREREKKRKNVY